jgi:hypothetical protein
MPIKSYSNVFGYLNGMFSFYLQRFEIVNQKKRSSDDDLFRGMLTLYADLEKLKSDIDQPMLLRRR